MQLKGVYPPLLTPINATGQIKQEALRTHVIELVNAGVDGLFPCGSLGEFSSLTLEQRKAVIKTTVDASGDSTVLAGCGGTAIDQVIRQTNNAHAVGADVAVVVVPYYLRTAKDGLEEFYETIANESTLPVMLYTIPELTGNVLPISVIESLSTHDNIIGIKDSSRDPRYHSHLLRSAPSKFTVLQGISDLSVVSLRNGSDGLVPGISNIAPSLLCEIYELASQGDYDRAVELQSTVLDDLLYAFQDVNLCAGLKYGLRDAGQDLGYPSPPLSELSDSEKDQVRQRLSTVATDYLYPQSSDKNASLES